jgi:hypothetical protein
MPAPHVPVELRECPEPALEPGSLPLRTLYSEVCGTDVHVWHGRLAGVWGSEVLSHFVRALRVLERHHTAIPWRAIGARTYTLSELNQALADADAMRLPKALVKPN